MINVSVFSYKFSLRKYTCVSTCIPEFLREVIWSIILKECNRIGNEIIGFFRRPSFSLKMASYVEEKYQYHNIHRFWPKFIYML